MSSVSGCDCGRETVCITLVSTVNCVNCGSYYRRYLFAHDNLSV